MNIEKIIERLGRLPGVSEKTMESIRAFDKENMARSLKAETRRLNLESLYAFLKMAGKPLEAITTQDIIDFFARAQEKYRPATINGFRITIGKYFKWSNGGECLPDHLKPVRKFFKQDNRINAIPKNLLTVEDIQKLVEAAYSQKEKLFPLFLYESGCRIGEALNLKLKDVQFDQYGAKANLEGKTGERVVRLIDAAPALREWINSHPGRKNEDSYVFCPSKNSSYAFSKQHAISLLRRLAKRAGITKRVNPHSFRHARATALCSELREYEMKAYLGWTMGSDMAKVYVHKSGMDIDAQLLANRGLIDANTNGGAKKEIPKTFCPSCKAANTIGNRFCYSCSQPLTKEAMQKYNQQKLGEIVLGLIQSTKDGPGYLEKLMEEKQEVIRQKLGS